LLGDEYCSLYFGKYIGERLFCKFLLIIFESVEKTAGHNDGGVDFICRHPKQEFINRYPQLRLEINKEYKIQLKMRCLIYYQGMSPKWLFTIKNDIADYFILCAWDNRENLVPLHIWMFHKDDIVRGKPFWQRQNLSITNIPNGILEFNTYELKCELDKLKELYDKLVK
jgi:hypothetical protein